MKNLIVLILLCMLFNKSQAQWYIPDRNDIAMCSVQFLAGSADGLREQVLYHPNELFKRHPNLNRQYWDSRISWHNKEHTWTPISDANHVLRLGIQTSNLATIGIVIGEKQKDWKVIARKIILCYLFNKAGFHLVYDLHFKNK